MAGSLPGRHGWSRIIHPAPSRHWHRHPRTATLGAGTAIALSIWRNVVKSVCVFCASSMGNDPAYADVAARLATEIARRGITLVYGGGQVGLMSVIADTALAAGGEVLGVMPRALVDREIAHAGLTELHITGSMHERKAEMERLSEGFIALPGGFGTLDEFCEIVTWAQLGYHAKPVGMLDANGYFDALRSFFDHSVEAGFVRAEHRSQIIESESPGDLLDRMAGWRPTAAAKWTSPATPTT